MVHAHAAAPQALADLAKGGGEVRAARHLFDLFALLLGGDAKVGKRLRGGERRILTKVHDVERGLVVAHGELDGSLERCLHVIVGQRHGTWRVNHEVDVTVGVFAQGSGNGRDVTEGGAHQHELGVGQRKQRHLPGPSAVGVGKEVELVHGYAADIGVLALAQGIVGKNLGSAANDWSRSIDVRIAGDHAHVFASEHLHQVKELLGHQRLDGRGVVRALALRHAHKEHAKRHERFSRSRGRAQDDMVARGKVHKSLFLVLP